MISTLLAPIKFIGLDLLIRYNHMLKIKESESKFIKPEAGAHQIKAVGLVDHGIVKATKADYKDQHKFSVIFMTKEGFQIQRNFSNSWGEKANWRKFITQWSGKNPEKVIDPEVILGYGGEGYLTQNGEYLNLTAIAKMKKSDLEIATNEVYISDYLRKMGDKFEVMFAPGFKEKVILNLAEKNARDEAAMRQHAQAQVAAATKQDPFAEVAVGSKVKAVETVNTEDMSELPF
jgi:hypothetical protein